MQEGGCRTSTSPAAPPLPPASSSCCAADISRCSYSSKSWSCSNYVVVSAHQWQVPRVRRTFSMSPVSKSSSPPSKSNKFWRPAPCSSSDRLSRSSSESSVWLTCIAESATGLGECPLSRMHGAAYLEVPTTTPAHVANAARTRNDAHRRGDPHRDGHGQQIYTRTHPSREVSHEGGARTSAARPYARVWRAACVHGFNIKSSNSQETAKIVPPTARTGSPIVGSFIERGDACRVVKGALHGSREVHGPLHSVQRRNIDATVNKRDELS